MMFTLEAIKLAHSQVRSGADFPNYIKALQSLGVRSYQSFVADGHTVFYGDHDFSISSPNRAEHLAIATATNTEQFKKDLQAHQQGHTNYPQFCRDCAASGIEKWVVSTTEMTCSYYDWKGNAVLVEVIPA